MRSDCIAICVLEKIHNKYSHFHIIKSVFLFRKKYSKLFKKFNKTEYIKTDRTDLVSEFSTECTQHCKQDCSFEYYIYDINPGGQISDEEYFRNSEIYIYHKQIPNIYIKHLPETTFISFISNFGGLLGMWLGISVIVIFENIFNSLKRMKEHFSRPKTTNFFMQNNIQFN